MIALHTQVSIYFIFIAYSLNNYINGINRKGQYKFLGNFIFIEEKKDGSTTHHFPHSFYQERKKRL